MPFFQVDDDLPTSSKVRTLAYERAAAGDLTGLAAMGLWTIAGASVQASLTDGVVSRVELIRATLDPRSADMLASLLVEAGFWHAPDHDCPRCPAVEGGTFLFHDWFDLRYDRGEQVKTTRRKRKELQDPVLVQSVWMRDCTDPQNPTIGKCRYCGETVRRQDRKSERAPEMDHVDPTKAYGARNVVLSCRSCNRKKGRRTPEEAGMVLRPAPRHEDLVDMVDSPRRAAGSPSTDPWVDSLRMDAGSPSSLEEDPGPPPAWAVDPEEVEQARPERTQGSSTPPGSGSAAPAPAPAAPDQDGSDLIGSDPRLIYQRECPGSDQIRPDQTGNQPDPLSRAGARPRVDAPGHGQGQGQGEGSGQGQGSGSGHRRRRRRKRSRGAGSGGASGAGSRVEVGDPPVVDPGSVPGRFGSAWYRHHGPPSSLGEETTCLEHGINAPCWKCEEER